MDFNAETGRLFFVLHCDWNVCDVVFVQLRDCGSGNIYPYAAWLSALLFLNKKYKNVNKKTLSLDK